jgi:hypothetical protein
VPTGKKNLGKTRKLYRTLAFVVGCRRRRLETSKRPRSKTPLRGKHCLARLHPLLSGPESKAFTMMVVSCRCRQLSVETASGTGLLTRIRVLGPVLQDRLALLRCTTIALALVGEEGNCSLTRICTSDYRDLILVMVHSMPFDESRIIHQIDYHPLHLMEDQHYESHP